jgi:hypothetical protein
MIETLSSMLGNLKAEILEPVLCKGKPGKEDFAKLDKLADDITAKHKELGILK